MVALDPLILLAVARVRSGVQEQSYSPDRRYTGHFFVSIKAFSYSMVSMVSKNFSLDNLGSKAKIVSK